VQVAVAVAHGDDERRVDEQHDLPAADDLLVVDVAHRLQHDEQRLAVDLELGALVRLYGVLDGKLVEVELAADRVELLGRRLVHAEPDEARPVVADGLRGLLETEIARAALAVLIDGAVDDHAALDSPADRRLSAVLSGVSARGRARPPGGPAAVATSRGPAALPSRRAALRSAATRRRPAAACSSRTR
jgi:hypothetical protein